jgi:hypothetical protein
MEVNAKLKELEDELKLLKAEIRNVLLDIREVILERTNPLGDEHESAFIRMDLNTTARAMAAEAAAHEAAKAADEAADEAAEAQSEAGDDAGSEEEGFGAYAGPPPETHSEEPDPSQVAEDAGEPGDEPPKVIRRDPRNHLTFEPEGAMETPTNIPPMYQATSLPPLSGNGSLSAWVTEAMDTIGPENLERVIAMERLWGALPPNISRALAYLQELLQQSQEARPPWLKVMQDLDRLASL